MAYLSISDQADHTADFLLRLRDFLVNDVGWTLHGDGLADAEPYLVLFSTGESGTEDIYLQFINDSNADRIAVRAWQFWDPVTHAGVNPAYHNSYTYIRTVDANPFLYWLYADLDHFFTVTKTVTTYFGHYSGLVKRFWSGQVTQTLAVVNPDVNVVVPVSNAGIFTVGNSYILKDDTEIERVQMTATDELADPQTVTLASVSQAYMLGAKLGEDPQPVIVGRYQSPDSFYAVNKYNGRSSNTGQAGTCGPCHGGIRNSTSPDKRQGLTVMFPWLCAHTDAGYQELRGELIGVHTIGSGAGDSEDVIDLGTETYKIFNLSSAGWCAVKE